MSFIKKTNSNQNSFSSSYNGNNNQRKKNKKPTPLLPDDKDLIHLSKSGRNKRLKEREFGTDLEKNLHLIETLDIQFSNLQGSLENLFNLAVTFTESSHLTFEETRLLYFDFEEEIDIYSDFTLEGSLVTKYPFLKLPPISLKNDIESQRTLNTIPSILIEIQDQLSSIHEVKEETLLEIEKSINLKQPLNSPFETAKDLALILETKNEKSVNTQANFKDQLFLNLIKRG